VWFTTLTVYTVGNTIINRRYKTVVFILPFCSYVKIAADKLYIVVGDTMAK